MIFNKPILCNYYVTLRCNSRCRYCDIWRNDKYKNLREQSLEEVKTNLKDLKELGVKFIDFTGGEPLLYKDIIPALKYAKRLGFYTSITTNGSLYKKFANQLVGLIDLLQFSLDSFDEQEHNKRRGVKCFSKVMKSIQLAKKLKQKPYVIFTIDEKNFKELGKVIDFCSKNKIGLLTNPVFSYFNNYSFKNEKYINRLIKLFFKSCINLDLAHLEFIRSGGNNIKKPICKALTSTIVISPDNYLLIPCFHHYFKKIKINKNLKKIHNSKELELLRKKVGTWEFCNHCTIFCYFGTSFLYKIFSRYFLLSVISGIKFLFERTKIR